MTKERLEQIGKFLENRMVIHRNVEHNLPWTTEEKMIVDLYDDYLDLKIENNKQKEVIDKAIKWIIKYQTEWCQEDEVIRDLKQLLNILKEVSE